jgi:hypothetical protein
MDPSEVKWEEFKKLQCPPHRSRAQVKIPCDPTPKGHLFYCEDNKKKPLQPTNSAERVFLVCQLFLEKIDLCILVGQVSIQKRVQFADS